MFSFQGTSSSKQTPLIPFPSSPYGSAANVISLCCFSSPIKTRFAGLLIGLVDVWVSFQRLIEIPSWRLQSTFKQLGCFEKWWAKVDSFLIRLYSASLCVIVRQRYTSPFAHFPLRKMVGQSGLEPPTSRLSVVCSSQLSYWPSSSQMLFNTCALFWWRLAGSNRWPPACKAGALPAELNPQIFPIFC